MNTSKKNKLIAFAVSFLYFIPFIVFGAVSQGNIDFTGANPINATNIYQLIAAILNFVVKIGAVLVVFFIIYSGFLFVTAAGNDAKISTAKTTFMWTIIGALILLGAQVLSEVVCNTAAQLGAGVQC